MFGWLTDPCFTNTSKTESNELKTKLKYFIYKNSKNYNILVWETIF